MPVTQSLSSADASDASHSRNPRGPRAILLGLVAISVACGGATEGEGERSQDLDTMAPSTAVRGETATGQTQRLPLFEPAAGAIGTEVELWMDGLPRSTGMAIGFGNIREHSILKTTQTDADGILVTTVDIPDTARPSRSHYFFVADADETPLSVSGPFLVTEPDGRVELQIDVRDASAPCPILQGVEEDEVYALRGAPTNLSDGDRVRVRGRVDLEGDCEGGLTIHVEELEIQSQRPPTESSNIVSIAASPHPA